MPRRRQPSGPSLRVQLLAFERLLLERALRKARSIEHAARGLGLPKTTLQYKLRKHGLRAPNLPKRKGKPFRKK